MKTRNYKEHEVVYDLNKKTDLQVKDNTVYEHNSTAAAGDIGIRSRGKISFLRKYCGYRHIKLGRDSFNQIKVQPKKKHHEA